MSFPSPRIALLALAAIALAAIALSPVTASAASGKRSTASSSSKGGKGKGSEGRATRRSTKRRTYRYSSRGPRARITSRRRVNRGKGVTIRFRSNKRRVRFQCRVDRRRWRSCRSPAVFRRVSKKRRRFVVRAYDRTGVVGAPTSTSLHGPSTSSPAPAPAAQPQSRPAPARAEAPADPTPAALLPAPAGQGPALQAPGFSPLGDAEAAARVVRSPFEPRPENGSANATVPTAGQLAQYRAARTYELCSRERYDLQVTGNFTGTTDEIIQWAAWKWGLDVELVRTAAVVETTWNQALVGDGGQSFGLLQLKRTVHEGTFPLSRDSTAFAADFYGAFIRHLYDGCATWMNDVERGREYRAGDIWGSMAGWYAGRWYANNADWYIGRLQTELSQKRWLSARF